MRAAPSSAPTRSKKATGPNRLAREVLARFGDRSLIRGVRIAARPQETPPFRPRKEPPKSALWAYIDAPRSAGASAPPQDADAGEGGKWTLTGWEVDLLWGALRDEFCLAGGRPLVGYSVSGQIGGMSTDEYAFSQRFPNLARSAFRRRADLVARRYGFQPVSIRFLHPRELAPIVVVRTKRDRKKFIADVREILALLDPAAHGRKQTATTFEGFYFEARDEQGPFVRAYDVYRGTIMGGQWSAEPDAYPFEHG
jgi:hypothetical protein